MGPVPRGSELTLSSYVDSARHGVRNLRASGGQLFLVATYLKTRERSDGGSVPRSLPRRIAQVLTFYLALVRPLELHYAKIRGDRTGVANYERLLFVSRGQRLSTRELSDRLNKVAQTVNPEPDRAHPFKWGVSIYRQTLKATYREVVVVITLIFIPRAVLAGDSYVDHAGFGHGARVGQLKYGVDMGGMVGITLEQRRALHEHCQRWHIWTDLVEKPAAAPVNLANFDAALRIANLEALVSGLTLEVRESKQVSLEIQRTVRTVYTPHITSATVFGPGEMLSVLPFLQKVTGHRQTKSPEQTALLQAAVHTHTHTLALIPTGGGKSVSFLVPVVLPGEDLTVVIIPFRALMEDVQDKLQALKIPYTTQRSDAGSFRILLLTLEVAFQEDTVDWMANCTRLRRIVVDEAHLVLIWRNFRVQYSRAHELGSTGKQVILLTATAPFKLRPQLLSSWGLPHATVIAAPHTHRPNLRYTFIRVTTVEDAQVAREMLDAQAYMNPDEAGIVFVLKRTDTDNVAQAYQDLTKGTLPYTAVGGEGAPIGNYAEWRDTPRSQWIVSTSALYHGVDHPKVRVVIFASVPDSVIEFQQASGRVARGLAKGDVRVLVPKKLAGTGGFDRQVMWNMAHGTDEEVNTCRRWMLSNVLDEHPLSCGFLHGAVEYCDNCEKAQVWLISLPHPLYAQPSWFLIF